MPPQPAKATLPHATIVLAMSADGKIADVNRSPARFGSAVDKAHLEAQVALADGVLFGAATLRAYGTTLSVTHPDLLNQRQQQGKPAQPVQIVCSRSAQLDPQYRFFRQPVPRWLLTTPLGKARSETIGAECWQNSRHFGFDRIFTPTIDTEIDWTIAFEQLRSAGVERLAIIGGGTLIASLLAANLIHEAWLTVCPLFLGGVTAPTPVEGTGFPADLAPRLQLLSAQAIDQEVFLHYRLQQFSD